MMEWQPIETAPKDGTWFLALHPNFFGDCIILGFHFGGWRDVPDPQVAAYCPTHWMPLPDPPQWKTIEPAPMEVI